MAAKEKKEKRPSLALVLVLGVLTILLGAFLGTLSLLSQPVREVRELPEIDQRDAGAVYYVKGRESGSSLWQSKRNQLIKEGSGEIMLSENELNQWVRNKFKSKTPAKDEEASGPTIFGLSVNQSAPNFRILENGVQLSVSLDFPQLSETRKFVYQTKGEMVKTEEGWTYLAESGFLGHAPLGWIPGVNNFLYQKVLQLFQAEPEWAELNEHWKKVSDLRFEEDRMILTIE